jgi:hypothetical protein
MTYRAPIDDILIALNQGAGLQAAIQAGHYGDFDGDITAAVLEEAGKFTSDILAPWPERMPKDRGEADQGERAGCLTPISRPRSVHLWRVPKRIHRHAT